MRRTLRQQQSQRRIRHRLQDRHQDGRWLSSSLETRTDFVGNRFINDFFNPWRTEMATGWQGGKSTSKLFRSDRHGTKKGATGAQGYYSRKLPNCSGKSLIPSFTSAIASCRISRFAPVTRTASP